MFIFALLLEVILAALYSVLYQKTIKVYEKYTVFFTHLLSPTDFLLKEKRQSQSESMQ